jgi:hypothetical protein
LDCGKPFRWRRNIYRRLDGIETHKGDAVSLQSRGNVVASAGRPSERIGVMFIHDD